MREFLTRNFSRESVCYFSEDKQSWGRWLNRHSKINSREIPWGVPILSTSWKTHLAIRSGFCRVSGNVEFTGGRRPSASLRGWAGFINLPHKEVSLFRKYCQYRRLLVYPETEEERRIRGYCWVLILPKNTPVIHDAASQRIRNIAMLPLSKNPAKISHRPPFTKISIYRINGIAESRKHKIAWKNFWNLIDIYLKFNSMDFFPKDSWDFDRKIYKDCKCNILNTVIFSKPRNKSHLLSPILFFKFFPDFFIRWYN